METLIARFPPAQSGMTRTALNVLFALDRTAHFLRMPPSLLARLHEPQVTKSLSNHLAEPATRLRRTQAIFDAVLGSGAVALRAADAPMAEAGGGPQDSSKRIDLLLPATADDGTLRCLAIEAKFGHHLTRDQLASYRRSALHHLRATPADTGAVPDRAYLVLIAPSLRVDDANLLAEDRRYGGTPEWRFLSWRHFLLRLERALPDDDRDRDFRQFLRLVWDRSDDG